MVVKVFIERRVKEGHEEIVSELLRDLRSQASETAGLLIRRNMEVPR